MHISKRAVHTPEQPISRLMGVALANPQAISLAAGFVDSESLPVGQVSSAVRRLLENPPAARAALQYGSNAGHGHLKTQIAERYFQGNPHEVAAQMILTAGSNQFLQLASECMLDPGDIVLCAAPTYFVYLYGIRDLGARAYGIPIDSEGMIPAALDHALRDLEERGDLPRVRLVYLVPYADNPAGTTMSAQRRREIIQVIEAWRKHAPLTLLVDNAYCDLLFETTDSQITSTPKIPLMTDLGASHEWTIETGTFSKNLSPGIRVGWGTAPAPFYEAIDRRKAIIDFGSPHFNQRLVSEILSGGEFDQHLELLRSVYRLKRDAMYAACKAHFSSIPGARFQCPEGGLYIWLTLPETFDLGPEGRIWKAALDAGVLYVPGEFFSAPEGHRVPANTARLSFGVQTPERIEEGIRRLAEVFERFA